jgi:hypothetical protein
MKSRLLITLLAISILSTEMAVTLFAQSNQSSADVPGAKLAENMVNRLEKAKLSDEQIAEIRKLAAVFGPRAWQIRKPVKITAEQRAAMANARDQGSSAGKSGAELTKHVHAAGNLNDEQIAALKESGKVYREFQQKAFALLTNRQRKRAGISTDSESVKREKKTSKSRPTTNILPASQS